MENSLRQEVSKCRGVVAPWARLPQHDGKIIEVFAPRRRKIIGPAPSENPQHTHTCTNTQHRVQPCIAVPSALKSLNKATRGLSPFSSTPFSIKAHLYSDGDVVAIQSAPGVHTLQLQIWSCLRALPLSGLCPCLRRKDSRQGEGKKRGWEERARKGNHC